MLACLLSRNTEHFDQKLMTCNDSYSITVLSILEFILKDIIHLYLAYSNLYYNKFEYYIIHSVNILRQRTLCSLLKLLERGDSIVVCG